METVNFFVCYREAEGNREGIENETGAVHQKVSEELAEMGYEVAASQTVTREEMISAVCDGMDNYLQNLLQKGFEALQRKEWDSADSFFEAVLDLDVQCARAYLGKLMLDFKVADIPELKEVRESYSGSYHRNNNYDKLMRFGDESIKEMMEDILSYQRINCQYFYALKEMEEQHYDSAIYYFRELGDFLQSREKLEECLRLNKELADRLDVIAAALHREDEKRKACEDEKEGHIAVEKERKQEERDDQKKLQVEMTFEEAVHILDEERMLSLFERYRSRDYMLFRNLAHCQGARIAFGKDGAAWYSIAREGTRSLLVRVNPVAMMPYHNACEEVTWETSSIRQWLNGEYYDTAFTERQKKAILPVQLNNPDNKIYGTPGGNSTEDRVFLLSLEDLEKYLIVDVDEELKEKTLYWYEGDEPGYWKAVEAKWEGRVISWWLRSPGEFENCAALVNYDNCIYEAGTDVDATCTVRPAVWVDVTKYTS